MDKRCIGAGRSMFNGRPGTGVKIIFGVVCNFSFSVKFADASRFGLVCSRGSSGGVGIPE